MKDKNIPKVGASLKLPRSPQRKKSSTIELIQETLEEAQPDNSGHADDLAQRAAWTDVVSKFMKRLRKYPDFDRDDFMRACGLTTHEMDLFSYNPDTWDMNWSYVTTIMASVGGIQEQKQLWKHRKTGEMKWISI